MAMKSICVILALAVAVHIGCGIQCLAAGLSPSARDAVAPEETPACHHESPEDTSERQQPDSSHHDSNSTCGLLQTPGSETSPILKGIPLSWAVDLPAEFASAGLREPAAARTEVPARNGARISSFSAPFSVLRI
jgi:hypothetical protein